MKEKKKKNQRSMFTSINTEKVFDKIQYPFMIKILRKLILEVTFCCYWRYLESPQLISYLKAECFSLILERRQECSFSLFLVNVSMDLASKIKQGKEIKVRTEMNK